MQHFWTTQIVVVWLYLVEHKVTMVDFDKYIRKVFGEDFRIQLNNVTSFSGAFTTTFQVREMRFSVIMIYKLKRIFG